MSDVEDVFIGAEAELPKKVTIDVRPSKEEVGLHNKTRSPISVGAPHCVRGKARRRSHRKRRRRERGGVPVISVDYMWMKGNSGDGEEDKKGNPTLVMNCRETKLTWARVVSKKGVDPYSIKVMPDMISFAGRNKLILKNDAESAITSLKDAVFNLSSLSRGVEVSPFGDLKANGEVERAIRTAQGQVRTLKSALDERYKTEFCEDH